MTRYIILGLLGSVLLLHTLLTSIPFPSLQYLAHEIPSSPSTTEFVVLLVVLLLFSLLAWAVCRVWLMSHFSTDFPPDPSVVRLRRFLRHNHNGHFSLWLTVAVGSTTCFVTSVVPELKGLWLVVAATSGSMAFFQFYHWCRAAVRSGVLQLGTAADQRKRWPLS